MPVPERWEHRRADSISVDFVYEGEREPGGPHAGQRTRSVLSDVPRSFSASRRAYATRSVTVLPEDLPAALFHWRDHNHYLDKLYEYVGEGTWHSG